jgi:hypothetical protein
MTNGETLELLERFTCSEVVDNKLFIKYQRRYLTACYLGLDKGYVDSCYTKLW